MARIDAEHVNDWAKRLDQLTKMLEDEFGYKSQRISGKLLANSAEVTFRVSPLEDAEPDILDTDIARAFKRAALILGLHPDDIGCTFKHKDRQYRLIGYEGNFKDCFILLDQFGIRRYGGESIIPSIRAAKIPA